MKFPIILPHNVNPCNYFGIFLVFSYAKLYVSLYSNFVNVVLYVIHTITSSSYKILMAVQNSIITIL